MSPPVRTALVIGGGIAGPVAAMALRKAGIDATVYEAHPTPDTGIGGSLAIAPNGLAALRTVDAQDAVLAAAIPIVGTVLVIGGRRVEMPGLTGLPPVQLIHRGDLHRGLRERAAAGGVPFVHGARLVDVTDTPAGVTATFADGSTATADVLIGADGVHSRVRTLIDPDAPGPRYTGLTSCEAHADLDAPGDPGTITFVFGRRAYYLYWPRPGGGTTWGANLPCHRPLSLTEARARPNETWLQTLRETYADDDPGRQLARATSPEHLQVTGSTHIMPSVPRWHRGRMVLVGDSVHAPSNSSGQGASLSVESAVELARCLRDLPDHTAAFTAYEALRRRRVEKIAAAAARINRTKAPGPVARAVLPVAMRILTRTALRPERTLGPVQRFRIDWDEPVTAAATAR